jgi:hypothetical protein
LYRGYTSVASGSDSEVLALVVAAAICVFTHFSAFRFFQHCIRHKISQIFLTRITNGHGINSIEALQRVTANTADCLAIDVGRAEFPVDGEDIILL